MKKLRLHRETLHLLDGAEARGVRGAFIALSIAQPEACLVASEVMACPTEQVWNCNTIVIVAAQPLY